jgi:hypothetical protein
VSSVVATKHTPPRIGPLAEARGQDVDMAHSVEEWQHHRGGTDSGGDVVERGLEGKCLDGEQHDVVLREQLRGVHEPRLQPQITVRADDLQPVRSQLLGARGPYQKGHVAPGLCQTRSEVSTRCTGPDNQNTHR